MYLSYYNLNEEPFNITSDPRFLWFSDKHQEALATLKYGIHDNKGFLLLTGDVGTGKTTLINKLINSLDESIIFSIVPDPDLDKMDLFKIIAKDFDMKKPFASKGEFLIHFREFLNTAHEEQKKVLLIIDESQRLSQTLFEEIRLLSNIEKQDTKLINIFFIGQQEFNDTILRPENKAILQRITVNYSLQPLNGIETGEYIQYRLNAAGASKLIFNYGAIHEIFLFSKGCPRLINIICDRALLTGYVKENQVIDADIIKECAKELRIKSQTSDEDSKNLQKTEDNTKGAVIQEDGSGMEMEFPKDKAGLEMAPAEDETDPKVESPKDEADVEMGSDEDEAGLEMKAKEYVFDLGSDEDEDDLEIESEEYIQSQGGDAGKDEILHFTDVGFTFDAGPNKGELMKFDVNFQVENTLSVILPEKYEDVIKRLKLGLTLKNVHFYSTIALLRGTGVVTGNKKITSGPNKGNYQVEIDIISI